MGSKAVATKSSITNVFDKFKKANGKEESSKTGKFSFQKDRFIAEDSSEEDDDSSGSMKDFILTRTRSVLEPLRGRGGGGGGGGNHRQVTTIDPATLHWVARHTPRRSRERLVDPLGHNREHGTPRPRLLQNAVWFMHIGPTIS